MGTTGGFSGAGWMLDSAGREVPRTERSDAARNRRRVLDAARRLFESRGVTRVSMEEIAREAGVGKGTLYRRFPDKGLLCQALLDEPTRAFQARTLALLGERGPSAREKLGRFLEMLVGFTEENLDLLYGGQESLCGTERAAHLTHPAREWLRATALGLLRAAVREGDLEDETDVEYLATALLAPVHVDLYYHQRHVLHFSPERIQAGLKALTPSRP